MKQKKVLLYSSLFLLLFLFILFVLPILFQGSSRHEHRLQCANLLKEIGKISFFFKDMYPEKANIHSSDSSLAFFQSIIEEINNCKKINPKLFICPNSNETPASCEKYTLKAKNISFEIVPWEVEINSKKSLMLFEKKPYHDGHRYVLFTDNGVEYLKEAEFQKLFKSEFEKHQRAD